MIQEIVQQAQAQLKQAQIAPMAAMDVRHPALVMRHRPQVNEPQVGQAGRQHQAGHAHRIAHMASIQLKSPAFLVGKEGLNVGSFAIPVTRGVHTYCSSC